MIGFYINEIEVNFLQSKLSLKDDASPLDGGNKSRLKLGLFSYPVLQAADILVHRYVLSVSKIIGYSETMQGNACSRWRRSESAPRIRSRVRYKFQSCVWSSSHSANDYHVYVILIFFLNRFALMHISFRKTGDVSPRAPSQDV